MGAAGHNAQRTTKRAIGVQLGRFLGCDPKCSLAIGSPVRQFQDGHVHPISSGVELHGRDYQTMNAVVDAAIAAAIEGFIGDDRKELFTSHADQLNAVLHEISNASWAARTAFDTLREGTVVLKSMTTAVLDRALRRIETLSAPPRRADADPPVVG